MPLLFSKPPRHSCLVLLQFRFPSQEIFDLQPDSRGALECSAQLSILKMRDGQFVSLPRQGNIFDLWNQGRRLREIELDESFYLMLRGRFRVHINEHGPGGGLEWPRVPRVLG